VGRQAPHISDADALVQRLKRRIETTGPISVADYMAEAGAFYYAMRDPFGVAGDFITAPEISQVFGELIGAWCADFWLRMGSPDPVLLIELGPGRGTLLADALRATRNVPGFSQAVRVHLVEQSPVLRQMQTEKLASFQPTFHDSIATLPDGPMLLIANEFLDALPIRQFERRQGTWHERMIGLTPSTNALAFCLDPQPSLLDKALPVAADESIIELCPAALALAREIGTRVTEDGGAALFIDYGYFPSACGDTFQALHQHRPVPVLERPGAADLTAHVDFAAFATASGAVAHGPVTQRHFLRALNIDMREAALLKNASPSQQTAIRAGCKRLIDPAAMGTLFKVLALTGSTPPTPSGFGLEAS
jgi:NADH dehydrogenase [ubiquinone] 1 alpha subcomplex assembly factor 7